MTKYIINLKKFDTEKAVLITQHYTRIYVEDYVDDNNDLKKELCTEMENLYVTEKENYFCEKISNANFTYYPINCIELTAIEVIEKLCSYKDYETIEKFFSHFLQDI
jgi:hypothetical protein